MRCRWRILVAGLLIDRRVTLTCCRLATPGRWTSASEASSSSFEDSGVVGRGFPFARAILHVMSCFAFLFLFLSAAASAASFRFFTTSA